MKQIYNFEQYRPPVLNENILRREQERRALRVQTALVALAGMILQAVVLILGIACFRLAPILTAICLGYVVVSSMGAGVLAIVYTRKGGAASWQIP